MSGQDHIGTGPVNAPVFPRPPVAMLLFMAAGWALNHFVPLQDGAWPPPLESVIVGGIIMACAVGIAMSGGREMTRAKTTFRAGGQASALVSTGVYKRTRNPMYVALTFFMLGAAIATANPWMAVLSPVLLLYLQERVVKREEAYLGQRFGSEYEDYKRRVRRWF
jgi:protein-S-isoprenylcysteine O-methyltransferase Ste14